jgi:hypothetical protein
VIDKAAIKSLDLVSFCIEKMGLKIVHDIGGRVFFYSPFRSETEPSFTVSRVSNHYKDWGLDITDPASHGDIINLVMSIENVDFRTAMRHIEGDYQRQEPPKFEPVQETNMLPGILVMEEKEIKDKWLIGYIENRKVDVDLCRRYCKELDVRFPYSKTDPDRLYSVIGFKNDSGGYEVRNSFLKKSTRPKTISTIHGEIEDEWMIFEGFFDYLSALQYFGVERFERKAVVLNTTAFLGSLYPMLAENKMNWMYLDRDTTGRAKIADMTRLGIPLTDCSYLYEEHKDFNDLWKSLA